jgi:prepilin-type N-terminal cleavage/methylation domain-containing protein
MWIMGNKKQYGFTLIELLVVISIIGLLSSVVLSSLNSAKAKARDAKRIAQLNEMRLALELYVDSYAYYPKCGTFTVCSSNGYAGDITNLDIKTAGYMSSIPVDPINTGSQYGYYYATGYKKIGTNIFTATGLNTDYIMAARLEVSSAPLVVTDLGARGWDNSNLNYLVGN